MLKVKINDDYNLYKKHTFEFNEGITCLIGRNGAGKSTLLNELKYILLEKNVFYYENEEKEKFAMDSFLYSGNINSLVRNYASSEGQNIQNNFCDVIPQIGAYVKRCIDKNKENVIILLDGLDSGISLDWVVEIKNKLFQLVIEDCKKHNLKCYIILSANNYEFCNGEDCITVSDAKHFKFKNYDDFRKIYIKE